MFLKRIEIYGFKSFADKIDIRFDGGITGIVGPNGSGKSNVADAVRWVLGEQNARSLRGAKMEDIIFGGTEQRKALSFCEVSLVFDNQDSVLMSEYSEVVVTRRLYRSGESEYLLNRSQCRLKDVTRLFQDTGIGKEGYSLIGQGRVDEILSNRSDERRMVFEEAAGIVRYRAGKEDAERRLKHTETNLVRISDIIDEMARQVEPLYEQSETAKKFLALRDTLRTMEVNLFLHQYDNLEHKKAEINSLIAGLAEECTLRQAKLEVLGRQAEQAGELLSNSSQEIISLTERKLEFTSRLEKTLGERGIVEERITHFRQDIDRLLEENKQAQNSLERLRTELSGDTGRHEQLQERLVKAREAAEALEGELTQADSRVNEAQEQFESIKNKMISDMNRLSDVRANMSRLEAMRTNIHSRIGEIDTLLSEVRKDTTLKTDAAEETKADAIRAEQEADAAEGKRNELSDAIRTAQSRQAEAEREIADLNARLHGANSRLSMLHDMKRDYEGYFSSVRNFMNACAQDSGLNKGVCGVVAQLVDVPAKLERAIETVLGNALQNIVTETEEDAKRAIAYLKKMQLGRATFLPISAVKGRTLNAQERATLGQGSLGVASELVSFDRRYTGVVESLLGRTVVTDNLDTAIRIARANNHAFRLVTLDGDIINAGGSMSGGSQQSKTTSLLSRDREIRLLEEQLESMQANIGSRREELDRLAEQLQEGAGRLREAESDLQLKLRSLSDTKEKYAKLSSTKEAADERLEQLLLEKERITETLDDIVRQISENENIHGDAAEQSSVAQQDISQGQTRVMQLRTERDAILSQVNQYRLEISGLEKEITTHTTLNARKVTDIAQLERQIAERINAVDELEARISNSLSNIQNSEGNIDDARATLDALNEEERLLVSRQSELSASSKELEANREALRQELQTLSERTHKAEMNLQKLDSDAEAMQNRIWDEYELTYASAQEYKTTGFKPDGVTSRVEKLKKEIAELGYVNVNAIQDYLTLRERYETMSIQRDDLEKAQNDLKSIISDLTMQMRQQFTEQFAIINANFNETFRELFGGGRAELRIEGEDVLESGIEIVAQPPGKVLQHLSLLSGGEKALTAIAILFAMLRLKPVPFCILDEIEAALDEANVSRFAQFLRHYCVNTQFIVITHRKPTMEEADCLYGVAMEEKGISRMVSVKLSADAVS